MATNVREYDVTLTGLTPLLMHWDNIEHSDEMERWKDDNGKLRPEEQEKSKAGDDRTPAWRWLGSVYHDGQRIVMPAENTQRMIMEAGAMMLVPGAKHGKTFKAQSQSGMMPTEPYWPLYVDGKEIPWAPLEELRKERHFGLHQAAVRNLGFRLSVKRARILSSKHVRVRPCFDRWLITGGIRVVDPKLTRDIIATMYETGGQYKGLGDWRPGSKTPGSFGMFTARVVER